METLKREEIINVIEGKGHVSHVPMTYKFWINPVVFGEKEEQAAALLKEYPYDIDEAFIQMPTVFDEGNGYCWVKKKAPENIDELGIDAVVAIEDWDELTEVLRDFPSPESELLFPQKTEDGGKYILGNWWYCFFERLWSLRGMENALTDFYTNPDEVKLLFDKLSDFYCRVIERAKEELHADGIFTSDDIGTQNAPFFSNAIFEEFFLPYYKKIIDKAHSLGMHFWLHTCGNIEAFIPYFTEIGLDVLHPIQKYTMDEKKIAEKYGDKICIWAGFDVQQTIPYGTPDDVRKEVRHLIDSYYRKDGRFILTLGNAATSDTKLESLEALLEESYNYGKEKCAE